jgi:hypothetical protein
MSETNSPVDEPPGEQGAQAPNPDDLPPLPDWGPGENPPGTNPPVEPPVDPATVPVPGSVPTFDYGGSDPGTVPGGPSSPPAGPPVNVDVPHVSQAGDTLSCTMGNWTNEPTTYSYLWEIEGVTVGGDSANYTVSPADVGMTATCTVTASNAAGATTAPPSNEVTIV